MAPFSLVFRCGPLGSVRGCLLLHHEVSSFSISLSLSLSKREEEDGGRSSSLNAPAEEGESGDRGGGGFSGDGVCSGIGRHGGGGVLEMAEICCGVVSGREASAGACEPSSRAARKRRMEIRRFRFVSGVAAPPADLGRKRQRIERCSSEAISAASGLRLDLEPAVAENPPPEAEDLKSKADSSDSPISVASPPPSSSSSSSSSSPPPSPSPSASPAGKSAASCRCPKYGMTSVCGRRRDMEDAISVRPAFAEETAGSHFFGVFDGHGCSHVAASCKDRMHEVVAEELGRRGGVSSRLTEPDWKAVMERSFARMDADVTSGSSVGTPRSANCRCEMQIPKCDHVGSTAVVAVVTPDRIVVSNCGDSRAVLCRRGVPVPLSADHKPDRPDELERIEAAGGRVIYWDGARVLGVLAMSRAIGDNYLKPYVISEPEVTVTERTEEDECLILASDGLWDVVANETACEVVRMCLRGSSSPAKKERAVSPPPAEAAAGSAVESDKACNNAALLLTKLALARQSGDNVSVVVVDLRRQSS